MSCPNIISLDLRASSLKSYRVCSFSAVLLLTFLSIVFCMLRRPDLKKVEEPSFSEDAEKPKAKKRKPTQKQLEEAELEAKPRYNEALRPAPCKIDSAFNIVTWNVASLSSTLRKDPQAISRLAEKESAHVVCLQVRPGPRLMVLNTFSLMCILHKQETSSWSTNFTE